jgi:magnesium-transporting ATPase (P-type)
VRSCLGTRGAPSDYDKTCAALSRNGSYVLALAFKELPVGIGLGDLGAWDRSNVERDLTLLGFMTFDNFVKVSEKMLFDFIVQACPCLSRDSLTRSFLISQEDSREVFASLRQGGIEAVMITGDSPYTAVRFLVLSVWACSSRFEP